jgi:hypothetical protein
MSDRWVDEFVQSVIRNGITTWNEDAVRAAIRAAFDEGFRQGKAEAYTKPELRIEALVPPGTPTLLQACRSISVPPQDLWPPVIEDIAWRASHTFDFFQSVRGAAIIDFVAIDKEAEPTADPVCPDCHGTGEIRLFTSVEPCPTCAAKRELELTPATTAEAHPLLKGPEDLIQPDGTVPIGPNHVHATAPLPDYPGWLPLRPGNLIGYVHPDLGFITNTGRVKDCWTWSDNLGPKRTAVGGFFSPTDAIYYAEKRIADLRERRWARTPCP